MSSKLDSSSYLGQGTTVLSLVGVVACLLANDALANAPSAVPDKVERELSARVATIVEQIRLLEPTLLHTLPAGSRTVQFANR
jgi:hypothetical protein